MTDLLAHIRSAAWRAALSARVDADAVAALAARVDAARCGAQPIYPPAALQFAAFDHTSPEAISVVILGQDPYHGAGQANGLAFSVSPGVKVPPSLRNILKEVDADIGRSVIDGGDLTGWAEQGVFLLNTSLSVAEGQAGAHRKFGWQAVTHMAVRIVSDLSQPAVFMLWGKDAHGFAPMIDGDRHLVLTSVHPSPLSAYRGFLGCKHFSKANRFLRQHGRAPVRW